jgi:hypothetical protein
MSLNNERWSFGIRGNGVHTEEGLRESGYVPDGFMEPWKVKAIEETRVARMPQHVIDSFKNKKAESWAAMQKEQAVDVDFTNADVLAKKAEDEEAEQRAKELNQPKKAKGSRRN